jgi:hypothetical protein
MHTMQFLIKMMTLREEIARSREFNIRFDGPARWVSAFGAWFESNQNLEIFRPKSSTKLRNFVEASRNRRKWELKWLLGNQFFLD